MLGRKADTSSCHRDPVVTMQHLRSPFPCKRWAWGAERELQGLTSPWAPRPGCRKPGGTASAQCSWPGSKAGQDGVEFSLIPLSQTWRTNSKNPTD